MKIVGFCKKHASGAAVAVYAGFLLLSGLVPSGMQDVSPFAFAAYFLGTGIVEEGVFCGVIFPLLRTGMGDEGAGEGGRGSTIGSKEAFMEAGEGGEGSHGARSAVAVTALMFALAHLSFSLGAGLGLLKVVQAFAFSLCMLALFARNGNLGLPMMVHGFFDVAYFTPAYMDTRALPPYPAAVSPDASVVVLAATALFFAICAAIIFRLNSKDRI